MEPQMRRRFTYDKAGKPQLHKPQTREYTGHNKYPDCKNRWALSAVEEKPSHWPRFLGIAVFLVMLGAALSQLLVHFWLRDKLSEIPAHKEVLQPVYYTVVQENEDVYLDHSNIKNGAKIIDEFSTPELHGVFSGFSSNKREALLSDENSPGSCWAFEGKQGKAAIQLSRSIYPRRFYIYHLNTLEFKTAPRELIVYGFKNTPEDKHKLGELFFDLSIEGEKRASWAYFDCIENCEVAFDKFILEVLDNYGANRTCVYQFKVQGIPANR